jgi:unsaturated rhamnogalacturonyl hydrolase
MFLGAPAIGSAQLLEPRIAAVAALPGEPGMVSAAGITRTESPLLTIENAAAFNPASSRLRLVIVGGLDGDPRDADAVLAAAKWIKSEAPALIRDRWIVSALPMADPDGHARAKAFQFPPDKGFYENTEQPESRYVWRWTAYQAPDLIVDIRGDAAAADAPGSLTLAFRDARAAGLGSVPTAVVSATAPLRGLGTLLAGIRGRSPLHEAIANRIARSPLDIARLLAGRYPAVPSISYIPALAWINTLTLSARLGDEALRAKVLAQVQPWLSGEKSLLGDRIQLTTVAGTMVFAEMANADGANAAARRLALEGADAALKEKAGGIPQYGQGWTDDMFMASAILARTSSMTGRGGDLDRTAQLLIAYAGRLQQPDGIFNHATDGPAAWGRGNGFAAFGLMETLTAMPATHPLRAQLLEIFAKQMRGLMKWQAPDGTWREIIDKPGAYREETATAMIMTAMARGVRLGWIDPSFQPVVERAWRALAAHITEDGGLVDVCSGTGAGPTARYYFDRPAVEGADDRGGAMALVAAMERLAGAATPEPRPVR